MIIILNKHIREEQKDHIRAFLKERGMQVKEIVGAEETIFGAVGVNRIDLREVELLEGVTSVIPISRPYKLASRELKKEDTIVQVGPVRFGGNRIAVIAGPCAVESREQMFEIARLVSEAGAVVLRGGAFKPRTSPYSFQGLGEQGLAYMKEAGEKYGLPITSEVVSSRDVDMMLDYVDMYQIGARNMQNFELLKDVGRTGRPVMLKRGLSATIEEWLMAAEYLMAHGTDNVILCERGIRTFERYTRNTLDLSAIPVVKKLSHLPIIVDPSHGTGLRGKVIPMGLASVAAGADGLMIEVHHDPDHAMSDGAQSLFPEQFERLMRDIQALSPVIGKAVERIPRSRTSLTIGLSADSTKGTRRDDAQDEVTFAAFQGVRGAYSEVALDRFFGGRLSPMPCRQFDDVFRAVMDGDAVCGVIPVENSLAGTINDNIDLLLRHPDIAIVGEQQIRIMHNLIGIPGASLEGLKRVYSHPQGLAQCSAFLDGLPSIERVPFFDTAGAVAHIAEMGDPTCAAIAGENAAAVYGMSILKDGIETNPRNYTRFYIITRDEIAEHISGDREPNRGVLFFSTPDTPGALFSCLKVLADYGLNMKKLESRPILGKPWEYLFFIETEIPSIDAFRDACEFLKDKSETFRVLGTFYSDR